MFHQSKAQARLSALIQRELGELLRRNVEPLFTNVVISIHYVVVTKDFNLARIYLSVFPRQYLTEVLQYLNAPEGNKQVRKWLASRIRNKVKRIPELSFFEDELESHQQKVENLLERLEKGELPDLPWE